MTLEIANSVHSKCCNEIIRLWFRLEYRALFITNYSKSMAKSVGNSIGSILERLFSFIRMVQVL